MNKNHQALRKSNSQIIQNSNNFYSLLTDHKFVASVPRKTVFNNLYFQFPKSINFVDNSNDNASKKLHLSKYQQNISSNKLNKKNIQKNKCQQSHHNPQKIGVPFNNFSSKGTSYLKSVQEQNSSIKNPFLVDSSFIIAQNKNYNLKCENFSQKIKYLSIKSSNDKRKFIENKLNMDLNLSKNEQFANKEKALAKQHLLKYRNSINHSLGKQNQLSRNNTFNLNKNKKTTNKFAQIISYEDYYISNIRKAFHFNQSNIAKQHLQYSFQAFKFMSSFKEPSNEQVDSKKICLDKKSIYKNKKTIILDLDQTLIHCHEQKDNSDIILCIGQQNGQKIEAAINIRPFALEALKFLSEKFELIIFTASEETYADTVINHLDPQSKFISHRLYRDSCIKTSNGVYIKDLRIFSNRNLNEIVLIDNSPFCYFFQKQNAIPILPYYEGKEDRQLRQLIEYLKKLQQCNDVRELNKRQFKLHRYDCFIDINILVKQLYEI